MFKDLIALTFFHKKIQDYRRLKYYRKWLQSGKPIPPPPEVKQLIVKEYSEKFKVNVFIETGTYLGDMVFGVKDIFNKIYSIELSPELYEKVENKFLKYKHIAILQGDSSKVLPKILKNIEEPCLLWLDAHYSEDVTAKGEKETPILEEINHIINHPIEDNVILIDDARCFTGQNDYPTIGTLRNLILSRYPDYVFDVKDDIIRVHR